MKRKFTLLIAALALLTMMASTGRMWGQSRTETTTTYTFTSKSWTATSGGSAANWTSGQDGSGFSNNGIQVTTNSTGANGTSPVSFTNVTKIVATYNTNKSAGAGSIVAQIGSNTATTNSVAYPGSGDGRTGNYTTEFNYTTAQTGKVKITVNTTTNSLYLVSVAITTDDGSSPSVTAANVEIAYDTNAGSIEYTINNGVSGGSLSASTTSDWLTLGTVGETVPFTCSTNEAVTARTATVTLTYTYNTNQTATKSITVTQAGNPNAPGTQNNPYTVAQARAAIDAGTGVTGVYTTGIVSAIVTPFGEGGYQNITFNMVDEAGDEVFLQAFRCVGDDAPNVLVGDIAVVTGNLTKYGTTYEFAQGCQVVSLEHPSTPYITAEDVNITYDATAGSIAYTIQNPVQGGQVTAATTSTWLTLGTDFTSPIAFTCDANEAGERTATVTLTYTYGAKTTVNKEVTVTQAGNPNVFDNISDITEVGTAYSVKGTVVAINSRGFIMGDGTGYVYYYKNGAVSQSIGDKVTVSGTTGTYGQIIQFTNTATVEEATTSNYNSTPTATVITEVPDYTQGYHLSTYFEFEGTLTKSNSNYFIALGESQIQISYPTTAQGDALTALINKTVHVKGYFSGINSSDKFTVMLESAEAVVTPTIDVTPTLVEATSEETEGTINVTLTAIVDNDIDIEWFESDGTTAATYNHDWILAEVTTSHNINYVIGANTGDARLAYFKVFGLDDKDNIVYSELITINQAAYEASITITPNSYNAIAAGETTSFNIDYINCGYNPEVHWFDANDIEQPLGIDWINTEFIGGYYVYQCTIAANTDEERVAKFEIRARDDNSNVYTSNRVTINQAAYVPSYTVTFDCDGGTFVANTDFTTVSESKEAGTYNLPSATKTGWDFAGWNDGTTTYEANAEYTVSAAVAFTAQWTEITTGSIVFGNNGTKINEASVTGDDSFGNTWTITTVGTTSFTQNAAYSQVGSSGSPATTITFTTTLAQSTMFTAFSAKFGGFSGTAGTVTLKVGETTVGSGSLNGGSDVIIENTSSATGTVLTVTVTGISKGVKCYYISYTISTGSDPMIIAQNSIDLSSTDTYGEFDYSIVNPGTGQLTASSTDGWISNINVTAEKVTFVTTPNTSTTDNREGTITLSYPNAANKNVTVTQSKVDYATIPFTFTGGKNAIETTAGLTENGLGNDYSSTANLRFDDTGDWVVLHLNEAPVSLSYDIKGNSFTNGSFAVQYSSNGTDYNTKVTYTKADITNSVKTFTIIDFPNETKYIRWIFTKSTGNVGFGNIHASNEYDTYGDVTIDSDALATHSVTVHSGSVVTFVGTNTNADKLVIEDGGQLIHTGDVAATLLKDYKATTWPNTKSVSGWYTIASPVNGAYVSVVTTTANYDFYAYDEANYTWRNEKVPANGITTFEQGVGYLYATSADKQGSFAGTMKATNAEVEKDLSYECTLANMKGFNLMGNPFTRNLTSGDVKLGDSYLTNYFVVEGGSELVAREIATYPIKPGQGFMVQATAENQKLVFNPNTAKGRSTNNGHISIAVGNESFNDMAYINIANGNTLRKMTLNTDSPKVYVMNNNKDYAAARVESLSASMPVCFQTKNIGTYTITVKANELDVEYLHLIDNVLHEDIDMLLEPSYSFIASGHDNAARFTLVFKANANIDEIEANDIFAYQNGSDIIVNGNGELQVFDATGRMVMNTQVNGIQTVNIPATGMYIFRMVGDEVKTQKIVVR